MAVDLSDEFFKLWTVPVVLNISAWLVAVDVDQLTKDWSHSLGRPVHRLQQQWYNRLL